MGAGVGAGVGQCIMGERDPPMSMWESGKQKIDRMSSRSERMQERKKDGRKEKVRDATLPKQQAYASGGRWLIFRQSDRWPLCFTRTNRHFLGLPAERSIIMICDLRFVICDLRSFLGLIVQSAMVQVL